jgi:hypothetical protein
MCFPIVSHQVLITRLKALGIKVGLVTNSIRKSSEFMLEYAGLLKFMDVVVTNEDVLEGKPNPSKIGNYAVERAAIQPRAVGTDQIALLAIKNSSIDNNAINADKIAPDSVGNSELDIEAVDSENYVDRSIDPEHYGIGSVDVTAIGGNAVGNIGSSAKYFNTVFARATSALYADLAECYLADAEYAPGTVLRFGGSAEVTASTQDHDPTIAGVVSTRPAYQMNSGLEGDHVVAVALVGRVPCQVQGPVTVGAMMVSAGNGRARAEANPAMGTVIGKAVTAFDGDLGTIEVVVGRL